LVKAYKPRKERLYAALSLLCVLLVGFSSFVQAVHVHPSDSRLPSHECSLCLVAHSGAVSIAPYRPAPVFARNTLAVLPELSANSFELVFSLRIRPPPEA